MIRNATAHCRISWRIRGANWDERTIENRALEEADEFEKHVLLDIRQLVVAGLAPPALNLLRGQTRGDVGLEPVAGDIDGAAGTRLLAPEGVPGTLLLIVILLLHDSSFGALGVAVGGDVTHEIAVLVELDFLLIVGDASAAFRLGVSDFEIARHCSGFGGGKGGEGEWRLVVEYDFRPWTRRGRRRESLRRGEWGSINIWRKEKKKNTF